MSVPAQDQGPHNLRKTRGAGRLSPARATFVAQLGGRVGSPSAYQSFQLVADELQSSRAVETGFPEE
jgi:hypothetical protein